MDYKVAFVTLSHGQTFEYPDLKIQVSIYDNDIVYTGTVCTDIFSSLKQTVASHKQKLFLLAKK